ncbi:MAG: sugar phosphate nucleotidyltransferase [Candidatus Omnitrophica bacterium]|nr:sugar phosphate nucleotidyltransferase [Candidatus Omnitrophota bacterium]
MEKEIFILPKESIKEALKKLDRTAKKVLLVVDKKNKLLGTLTDGDIRRYILKGKSLEDNLEEVYNRNPKYIEEDNFSIESARELFIKHRLELLPIVDSRKRVVDFLLWSQVFSEKEPPLLNLLPLDVPVVIMAGGKGGRLDPFTKVLPKPLIPIGDKPIIELIIDEFKRWGAKEFYLILNYKAEIIQSYFEGMNRDYKLHYIREKDFLGTVGGLSLLEDIIDKVFIVSNCDVIVKADFGKVVKFHKDNNVWLTILSSVQHYKIPYGIIKFKKKGKVTEIVEKPEQTFIINTGVYVIDREALKFITKGSPVEMNELIMCLLKNKRKVVTYPVNENDYIDIGQWEEYKKSVEKISLSKLII